MDYIIIFIAIIGLLGFALYAFKENNQETNSLEDELTIPVENEMPLQDKTYRLQNRYNNYANNKRTNEIKHVLNKIHFWLVIIGTYILIKIIVWAIVIATKGLIITELLQMMLENFS